MEGPTAAQLDGLPAPEVATICGQSGVWQSRLDDPAITGWLHDESPDNAQEQPDGSFGPCIEPSVMRGNYERMTERDGSRPVLLLLGQGTASTPKDPAAAAAAAATTCTRSTRKQATCSASITTRSRAAVRSS